MSEGQEDVELTIVVRFREGFEPEEEEVRHLIEDVWCGTLLTYELEEV